MDTYKGFNRDIEKEQNYECLKIVVSNSSRRTLGTRG
jgi:hypothetical protein